MPPLRARWSLASAREGRAEPDELPWRHPLPEAQGRNDDVADDQDFARRMLATAPGIRAYTSEIVLAVNKHTTELPLPG